MSVRNADSIAHFFFLEAYLNQLIHEISRRSHALPHMLYTQPVSGNLSRHITNAQPL